MKKYVLATVIALFSFSAHGEMLVATDSAHTTFIPGAELVNETELHFCTSYVTAVDKFICNIGFKINPLGQNNNLGWTYIGEEVHIGDFDGPTLGSLMDGMMPSSSASAFTLTLMDDTSAAQWLTDLGGAPVNHSHVISDTSGLQAALDAKLSSAPVGSVFGRTGAITATAGDYNLDQISDGTTNKAFTALLLSKLNGIQSAATANSTDATLLARSNHTGTQAISTVTGLQTALDAKFSTPAGTTAQYVRGDGSLATLPTAAAMSINDSPGRSLVTSTSATGYQLSSTRNGQVCYEGSFQTTSTIGGPASVTVFLETANTNSTTPGDWTTIAQQVNSNNITLAIALNQVDTEPWSICRNIPAGKYVRVRSGNVTGTASASINTQQQETLY